MKKIKIKQVFAMLSVVFAMFFAVNSLMASECLPDCLNDPWGQLEQEDLVICEDQSGNPLILTIKYKTRLACNMYYDIYIEEFWLNGTDLTICYGNNFSYYDDVEMVLNDILLKLLAANPMNLPPTTVGDPCENNWRVMKGGCWSLRNYTGVIVQPTEPIMPTGDYMYAPCSLQNCCLEFFTVCIDSNGDRIITHTGYQEPPEPCVDEWCKPVCGSIYR